MYGIHEEPLYKDPLNKKFQCQHCGNLFRTRQGLSGHIQFKHGIKQYTPDIAINDIEFIKDKLQMAGITLGMNETTTQVIEVILDNWTKITTICEELGIDLNKQDFKNYFVAGLADMYQS